MDMGHGLHVAIAQIVAEELDVPYKAVKVYMGDTGTSVNQGGASGSTGIQLGGKQMRMVAAEARRVLVDMAAGLLSVRRTNSPLMTAWSARPTTRPKRISYAQMIGGKYFQRPAPTGTSNTATRSMRRARRSRRIRKTTDRRQPIKREDVAPKVFAQEDFCTDVKVPGMVHGRMIRPAVAGSVPVKVDEASIKDIPGAQVVWDKGFLGVVATKEWDAIKAAES